MDETRCKEGVHNRLTWRTNQCRRKIWKDGYCKQHHPETVAKRREKAEKRWEEKRRRSVHYKLYEALEKIEALEAENILYKFYEALERIKVLEAENRLLKSKLDSSNDFED